MQVEHVHWCHLCYIVGGRVSRLRKSRRAIARVARPTEENSKLIEEVLCLNTPLVVVSAVLLDRLRLDPADKFGPDEARAKLLPDLAAVGGGGRLGQLVTSGLLKQHQVSFLAVTTVPTCFGRRKAQIRILDLTSLSTNSTSFHVLRWLGHRSSLQGGLCPTMKALKSFASRRWTWLRHRTALSWSNHCFSLDIFEICISSTRTCHTARWESAPRWTLLSQNRGRSSAKKEPVHSRPAALGVMSESTMFSLELTINT